MDFDTWLSQCLQELKTDEAVFGPYIRSIVEGDEDLEQKIEDLDGILSELGDPSLDVESLRTEILSRWRAQAEMEAEKDKLMKESKLNNLLAQDNPKSSQSETTVGGASSLDTQLEQLLRLSPSELAGSTNGKVTDNTAPDSDIRAAILKQYQQDDSDSNDEDGPCKHSSGGLDGLSKNTNAERVLNAQKEQKEKAKADSAAKRAKDKEDRAKQKKLAEEKKEKAKKKTAKVERKSGR